MNNISYVRTPTFVVNANGKVSDNVRPDTNKGQKVIQVETRNFDSLKNALSWINKEGQKKSTNLYLFDIRPSAHGAYNVRCAIMPVKKAPSRPSVTTNAKASSTNANRVTNASNKADNNRTANTATKPTNAKRTVNAKLNADKNLKA